MSNLPKAWKRGTPELSFHPLSLRCPSLAGCWTLRKDPGLETDSTICLTIDLLQACVPSLKTDSRQHRREQSCSFFPQPSCWFLWHQVRQWPDRCHSAAAAALVARTFRSHKPGSAHSCCQVRQAGLVQHSLQQLRSKAHFDEASLYSRRWCLQPGLNITPKPFQIVSFLVCNNVTSDARDPIWNEMLGSLYQPCGRWNIFSWNLCLSVTDILYPLRVVSLDTSQNYSIAARNRIFFFHAIMQGSSDSLRCKA